MFIVFEGLDGAGTTTQARRLHDRFTSDGRQSFATFEPTSGPIGSFIRNILSGRLQHEGNAFSPGEHALALLFAADRLAHTRDVERERAVGRHVVCDRYVFSSMAYQSLDPSISGERVVELNRGCAMPDITLFLSVPVDVCMSRISARGESETIYEKRDALARIAENYEALLPLYRTEFGKTVVIDGNRPPDDVHVAVMEAVRGAG